MDNQPIRRRAALGLLAGAAALAAAGPAAALSIDAARDFVSETVDELFAIARAGGAVPDQRRAFRALLERRMAVDAVARTCLGVAWRSASPAQQTAYLDAFKHYVSIKYGSRFDEFGSARLEIVQARDFGDRGVVVESRGTLPNGESAVVEWGVSDRSGRVLISNIVVEGVSLVTSEREQIGAMLEKNRGNVDGLIADLNATA
jgi:phospholipid transport system substrate-binding protein